MPKVNIGSRLFNVIRKPNILPCPFCGHEVKVFTHAIVDNPAFSIECPACGAVTMEFPDFLTLLKYWNERVEDITPWQQKIFV